MSLPENTGSPVSHGQGGYSQQATSPRQSIQYSRSPQGAPYASGDIGRGPQGKSKHLSTVKSLGLIHDLQEYISSVELLAAQQRHELDKVREEKRGMEKVISLAEAQQEKGVYGELFSNAEYADLPPKLRSIFEDNRSLRDQVRKQRQRTVALQQEASTRQAQLVQSQLQVDRLKSQLALCSRTPADVSREETLKTTIEQNARSIQTLERSVSVLKAKVETDAKLYKQSLAAAGRERDQLKKQLVAAGLTNEEKDKQVRALLVEVRRLQRKLAPQRSAQSVSDEFTPEESAESVSAAAVAAAAAAAAMAAREQEERERRAREEAEAAAAAAAAASAAALAEEQAAQPAEGKMFREYVKVMFLVVKEEVNIPEAIVEEEPPPPEPEPEPEPELEPEPEPEPELEPEPDAASAAEEQAVLKIQSAYRGFAVRRQLATEKRLGMGHYEEPFNPEEQPTSEQSGEEPVASQAAGKSSKAPPAMPYSRTQARIASRQQSSNSGSSGAAASPSASKPPSGSSSSRKKGSGRSSGGQVKV